MRHVMPLAFPRNVILLRTFKTFYVIFLECANATMNCISSMQKTSLSDHLQILNKIGSIFTETSPSQCSELLLLKVANLAQDSLSQVTAINLLG